MQGIRLDVPEETVRSLASELSDTHAAERLGIARSSFFLLRRRYGVSSFTRGTGCRQSPSSGKLLRPGEGTAHPATRGIAVDCFETIDSPEKSYYLGLLAADGHASIKPNAKFVAIELQEPDCEVLSGLARLLGSSRGLERINRKGKKPSGRLRVHSRPLVESLVSRGITLNTEEHFIPDDLPREFRPHCLRGLLDGDGHIDAASKNLYLCSCSEPIITSVTQWALEDLGLEASVRSRILPSGKRFYYLTFGGEPRKVLKWAYGAPGPVIARKKEEADLWLSMCE